MEKKITYSISVLALLVLVNSGFKSAETKELPAINFYGTVKTHGVTERAINITIAGSYANDEIVVYNIPATHDVAPTGSPAKINNLSEVKAIRHHPTKEPIQKYLNREYVKIEVEFIGGKKQEFLVERSRKLNYQVPVSEKVTITKEPLLEMISEVVIEGHKQRALKDNKQLDASAAKDAVCKEARAGLEKLKETMPNDKTGIVEQTEKAVNYLCA